MAAIFFHLFLVISVKTKVEFVLLRNEAVASLNLVLACSNVGRKSISILCWAKDFFESLESDISFNFYSLAIANRSILKNYFLLNKNVFMISLKFSTILLSAWFLSMLRHYATFEVRKFESLFYRINSCLQKTTTCIKLQAEKIFNIDVFLILGVVFTVLFLCFSRSSSFLW